MHPPSSITPCSDDGAIKELDSISLGQLIEWDRLRMGQCLKKMVQWYHQGVILYISWWNLGQFSQSFSFILKPEFGWVDYLSITLW